MIFKVSRLAILAIWITVLINLVTPFDGTAGSALKIIGVAMLAAHIFEYLAFHTKIKRLPQSAASQFLNTILFGLAYWKDPSKRAGS